ncbi:MFS transporter [Miltoncostaea oceani]|uniref:MFS transporter n=1 Tax=Miltoncostaea oceani TaxID=2843216 RepID=UPI001C3DA12E|nr:MFS transporter [Miltoncostaea oceani]
MLAVGMTAQAGISAVQLGLPAVAPEIRDEYGLSLAATGALLAASTVGIIATLLAWGALADRIGERAVIGIGLSGAAGALALASLSDTAVGLGACLVLAGAFGSSANAASGRAVVAWFGPRQRGFALGLRHMSTPLGGAVAAALLPLAVHAGGLSAALLALAGACLVGALAAGLGLRRPDAPAAAVDDPPPTAGPLRDPAIWRLSLGTASVVLAQISLLSFLALYLHEERGWSVGAAALTLAVVQVGGAVARVAAGAWSDRVGSRLGPLRLLAASGAATLGLAAAVLGGPDGLAAAALVVAGVLTMAGNGVSFAAAAEMAGAGRVGTALGLQNTILFVAVALAPPLFGGAVGLLSWPAAFGLAALCPLVGWWVLGPLAARERRPGAAAGSP